MRSHLASSARAGLGALMMLGLLEATAPGRAQSAPPRISFQIAAGSTAGTYFPVAQTIAGLLSNPPGVDRCEQAYVCGPAGLIMNARTSAGAVDNVLSVNAGRAESGLAQSDVVAAAVKGSGAFRKPGKQTHIRILAALFPEYVHLIVAKDSKIQKVADLRGKRVSLGAEGSGTSATAREVLEAYGLSERRIKAHHESADQDAQMLQKGTLDAFFFVGGLPVGVVGDLLGHGTARLVAIDGKDRDRLVKRTPGLVATTIPSGTYPGMGALATVASQALWIVRDSESDTLIYGIARALFNPLNRLQLAAGHPSARDISLATAAKNLPAPLHTGAARFYKQAGAL